MKYNQHNVLVIGDTHIPFELKGYLEFCKTVQDKYGCGTIVHVGDLVDNHAINYHEHDPNGKSPKDEMEEADKHLQIWFKVFPNVFLCRGNHDSLVDRKGKTSGLPERAFRQYRDIWNLPKGWVDDFEFDIDGVLYKHGTSYSGLYPHVSATINARQSVVIGHCHSVAGIEWLANAKECIFGLSVGCGIDRKAYAFSYGKDFRRKPVIGCGIVLENGKYAQFIPAPLWALKQL
jgi:predicted phosphodiesterase